MAFPSPFQTIQNLRSIQSSYKALSNVIALHKPSVHSGESLEFGICEISMNGIFGINPLMKCRS